MHVIPGAFDNLQYSVNLGNLLSIQTSRAQEEEALQELNMLHQVDRLHPPWESCL